ncbi:hypothetical protein ABVK25_010237 [Lepraria finkii]|uniref:Uncharacterized protein n=1 Tax=Lepraria finkii TaxID=1340010 RepID=A0ABR4AV42_9LECA
MNPLFRDSKITEIDILAIKEPWRNPPHTRRTTPRKIAFNIRGLDRSVLLHRQVSPHDRLIIHTPLPISMYTEAGMPSGQPPDTAYLYTQHMQSHAYTYQTAWSIAPLAPLEHRPQG